MKKELAQEWVDALRSGRYKKGKRKLKDHSGGYCCLGVLADMHEILRQDGTARYQGCISDTALPSRFRQDMNISLAESNQLIDINDSKDSFEPVAKAIEQMYIDYV